MAKIPTYECKKCGRSWTPRVPNPVQCPKCRNRKWKFKKVEQYKGAEQEMEKVLSEETNG